MRSSTILLILITFSLSCLIIIAQNSPQDYLDIHNQARAEVGVDPLSWDETVAAYAEDYARSRIETCEMVHSGGPYGENLAEGSDPEMNATVAVNLWLAEKANYDYDNNSCVQDECRHYTQMIWRDTVYLGCARASCNSGWTFFICSYDPPGNYVGERPY